MDIIKQLTDIDIIQHGNFVLKSGLTSNIYIDLRKVINYPMIYKEICHNIFNLIDDSNIDKLKLCGIPYGGIPCASFISIQYNIPMIFFRKEKKNHGTKKLIEGVYNTGDEVILIEDVITTGSSIKDAFQLLQSQGLIIKQIIVIFSRHPEKNLVINGVPIQYLYHIDDL